MSYQPADLCVCGHPWSDHAASGEASKLGVALRSERPCREVCGPFRPCPCTGFSLFPETPLAPELPDDSPAVLAAAAEIATSLGYPGLATRLRDLAGQLDWPAHWPPRPGDVWRSLGGQLWFTYRRRATSPVVLVSAEGEHLTGIELSTAAKSLRLARAARALSTDSPCGAP